jgi:phospholipid/cholesterol/gamma-HCH transport system substrate-binding protein
MAERSASVMRNLEESTERLNRAMQDTQQLIKSIQSQNGAVKQFFTDPALYNNLNDAACMATRILPRVDRVLRDLEVFADKIARHPEALGVGGVVRPGSGLK